MMSSNRSIQPTGIKVHKLDKVLRIEWESGAVSQCSFSELRKMCPCAECRASTDKEPGQLLDPSTGELQLRSQKELEITSVEVVGNYALRIEWSDGHSHGIFTWEYLRDLCTEGNS